MTTSPAELQAIRERDKAHPNDWPETYSVLIKDRRTLLALYDAQLAEVQRLTTALKRAREALACKDDHGHYCTRCDNSTFNDVRAADASLGSQP
jgi:hypothetical protein